jgi:hypothetical protein
MKTMISIEFHKALQGKEPRKITIKDFEKVLERRKSSLIPWFRMALQRKLKCERV